MKQRVKDNPNATAAIGSGTAATLLVGALGYFGWEIDPVFATALGGVLTAAVLLVGRKGVRGVVSQLWRGSGD